MIEVQHLTKKYGPVTAVEDVSFRVERGEIFGFLGPNGAGKTTTMRMLVGLIRPTSGSVRVAGDEPGAPEGLARVAGFSVAGRPQLQRQRCATH